MPGEGRGSGPGRGRAGEELRAVVSAALKRAAAEGSELGPAVEAAARDWLRRYQPVNVSVRFIGLTHGDAPAPGKLVGRLRICFETLPVAGETTISMDGADVE